MNPVELERLVPKNADATRSLRDAITPVRNSRAKRALMQIKHQQPKSCRTNHKTSKNAMKKWREDVNLTTHHHILTIGKISDWICRISVDIGLILSYIQFCRIALKVNRRRSWTCGDTVREISPRARAGGSELPNRLGRTARTPRRKE